MLVQRSCEFILMTTADSCELRWRWTEPLVNASSPLQHVHYSPFDCLEAKTFERKLIRFQLELDAIAQRTHWQACGKHSHGLVYLGWMSRPQPVLQRLIGIRC